jgi:hypothetical protein
LAISADTSSGPNSSPCPLGRPKLLSSANIQKIITTSQTIKADQLWNDPKLQFNELGPQLKGCSFASIRGEKMEPNYRFYTHETTFAFVDTLSDSHVLNERLLFWVELFKIFDKKPCQLLLVKDFIAKRSLKVTPCSKSSVVDIDFSSFEIVERDVSGIQEHEFDMRKHIDEKE